jgi:hypothetical protein
LQQRHAPLIPAVQARLAPHYPDSYVNEPLRRRPRSLRWPGTAVASPTAHASDIRHRDERMKILEAMGLRKTYRRGKHSIEVLR